MSRKHLTLLFFTLSFLVPSLSRAQFALDVVYPKENQTVLATDSTFVFGAVSSSAATVFVNGNRARMYPNGAFLINIPVVERGDVVLRCKAIAGEDTIFALRNVAIPKYPQVLPLDSLAIDSATLQPVGEVELLAGDELLVSAQGTPGLTGRFSIPGYIENGELRETLRPQTAYWGEVVFGAGAEVHEPMVAGIYQGTFRVPHGKLSDSARVHVTLSDSIGREVSAVAPARLSIRSASSPRIAKLTAPMTTARTGPGLGYQMFLPEGVKLAINGKKSNFYRADISGAMNVWVPATSVAFLQGETSRPRSHVDAVRADDHGDRVAIKIYLQEKLPYKIEQSAAPTTLKITLYGAVANTDWIRHDFRQKFVKELTWAQPADNVYELTARISSGQQWGYNPFYDGRVLVVEVRKPPHKFSLKDKLICLDPGHGQQDGAIGPKRTTEKAACLQLALVLKEKLEKKGASVFLTRDGQNGATLGARVKMATLLGSDLFLSLHYNALPDGVNPFSNRGTSSYYYHPQSRPLAAAIQKRLLEKLKLQNYGLFYDNLAVCRITQMPSVLIEPAFIMHPEEEAMLSTAEFRGKTASAIVSGIEDFYKRARKAQ